MDYIEDKPYSENLIDLFSSFLEKKVSNEKVYGVYYKNKLIVFDGKSVFKNISAASRSFGMLLKYAAQGYNSSDIDLLKLDEYDNHQLGRNVKLSGSRPYTMVDYRKIKTFKEYLIREGIVEIRPILTVKI